MGPACCNRQALFCTSNAVGGGVLDAPRAGSARPYKRKTGTSCKNSKTSSKNTMRVWPTYFSAGSQRCLNLVVFAGFQAAFGTDFAAGIGNIPRQLHLHPLCLLDKSHVCVQKREQGQGGPGRSSGSLSPAASPRWSWIRSSSGWAVSLLGPHVAFAAANGKLWAMGVKLFSQVIVIVSNYVFSKLFIFKKK